MENGNPEKEKYKSKNPEYENIKGKNPESKNIQGKKETPMEFIERKMETEMPSYINDGG